MNIPAPTWHSHYNTIKGNARTDTQERCPIRILAFNGMPDRIALLREGDVIEMLCVYTHHSARMIITKVNKKSFKCTEISTSYNPGCLWYIPKGTTKSLHIEIGYTSHERLKELAASGWEQKGY